MQRLEDAYSPGHSACLSCSFLCAAITSNPALKRQWHLLAPSDFERRKHFGVGRSQRAKDPLSQISLPIVSWHKAVHYERGQLVRQAAVCSASLFSCTHLSLPSTARLMKANEREDETKFLWWIPLPFSKCNPSHFSAIGMDRDDNISFKSPALMISSLNGKLVIAGKGRHGKEHILLSNVPVQVLEMISCSMECSRHQSLYVLLGSSAFPVCLSRKPLHI